MQTIRRLPAFWEVSWSGRDDDESSNPLARKLTRVVATIMVYVALDRGLAFTSRLPESAYFGGTLVSSFWSRLFEGFGLVFLIPVALCLIWFFKRGPSRWQDLENAVFIRVLTIAGCFVLTWKFTTLDHNLYYGEGYYLDRALLFVCALLTIFRPFFLIPFLTTLLPLMNQVAALPGYSIAIESLPLHLVILSLAVAVLYAFNGKSKTNEFAFLSICLVPIHYFFSGLGKLRPDWILYDFVPNILPATYANGWLGYLSPDQISDYVSKLGILNVPIKIATLFLEAGSLLFVWHKRIAIAFLCGWVGFHIGIFAVSGIFFWMWIVIDIFLLLLLVFGRQEIFFERFNLKYGLLASAVVILGLFWVQPPRLVWFDVPFTYTYRLHAGTSAGRNLVLPPSFFSPYEYQFTLGQFQYLNKEPTLTVTWGASDFGPQTLRAAAIGSKNEFLEFEKQFGRTRRNEEKAKRFFEFIDRFIENHNERGSRRAVTDLVKPPAALWTFPGEADLGDGEQIEALSVVRVTSLFVNGKYTEIDSTAVFEISVPAKTKS